MNDATFALSSFNDNGGSSDLPELNIPESASLADRARYLSWLKSETEVLEKETAALRQDTIRLQAMRDRFNYASEISAQNRQREYEALDRCLHALFGYEPQGGLDSQGLVAPSFGNDEPLGIEAYGPLDWEADLRSGWSGGANSQGSFYPPDFAGFDDTERSLVDKMEDITNLWISLDDNDPKAYQERCNLYHIALSLVEDDRREQAEKRGRRGMASFAW
ncbi:hypothetical protein I302_102870 [Kwoniella bestiolae CBS 10118]|uniref:Uncharacterized protein n=1 Tax=Kwoniella bestiolae CBS 10118 TaxID=1296100 RepID=A0A1B9GGD9_9TREE|nr:hypothetical protein I302_01565 [Kwoniella bestiolae CBS 10118]OCF30047.1 hypothetical protein I302_01565 [Kwoniella bestiolae CBS 10118]